MQASFARSVIAQVRTPHSHHARPAHPHAQSRRNAFAFQARLASTKATSLKDRVAELIPAELENVRTAFLAARASC